MRSTKDSTIQSVHLKYMVVFFFTTPMIPIFMYSPMNSSIRPLLMCIFIKKNVEISAKVFLRFNFTMLKSLLLVFP